VFAECVCVYVDVDISYFTIIYLFKTSNDISSHESNVMSFICILHFLRMDFEQQSKSSNRPTACIA